MRVFLSGGSKNGKSLYAQRLARLQGLAPCSSAAKDEGKPEPVFAQAGRAYAYGPPKPDTPLSRPLYYIATMEPYDAEDAERIGRHRRERDGWGFTTIEQPVDIEDILDICDAGGSFLLDSLTALLANEMFGAGGAVNEKAAEKILAGMTQILSKVENIVVVSDYIYSDAMHYDRATELYRKSLAGIDRRTAGLCDAVLEIAYSGVVVHKGRITVY